MSVLFDTGSKHIHRSAEISECGRYRWWLRRSWQLWDNGLHVQGKGTCCFGMLNPSDADGTIDDPTVRRCVNFARSWGYDAMTVRNLFPFRSPDPKSLLTAHEPTGGHRGDIELLASCTADLLVVAWGAGVPFGRDRAALAMFADHFPDKPLYCLGKTKQGHPRHPLYVRADKELELFTGASL
jgi:hypothetical protein